MRQQQEDAVADQGRRRTMAGTAGTGGRSSFVVIRCPGDHAPRAIRNGRALARRLPRLAGTEQPVRRSAAPRPATCRWRSPGRPLAADHAWLQPCCAPTRPLPFGACPPGSGTAAQPPRGRCLVRQPVRRGGPGRSSRPGSRPGSPARIGRSAWSLLSDRVCGSEPGRASQMPASGRTARPAGTSGRSARLRRTARLKTPSSPPMRR